MSVSHINSYTVTVNMPKDDTLTLSELAGRTGVSPRGIRYYLTTGLLRRPPKLGRELQFKEEDVYRLRAIRDLQKRGLSLEAIGKRLAQTSREELERMGRGRAPPLERLIVAQPTRALYTEPVFTAALSREYPKSPRRAHEETWVHVKLAPLIELHYDAALDTEMKAAAREIVEFARRRLGAEPPEEP
jgi:DNA-binding transcriptional MerR regulator